jgi:hypothetical protein
MSYLQGIPAYFTIAANKAMSLSSNYIVGAIKADSPKSNHITLAIKAISQQSNYNMILFKTSDTCMFKVNTTLIKRAILITGTSAKKLSTNTWKIIDYLNGVKVRYIG